MEPSWADAIGAALGQQRALQRLRQRRVVVPIDAVEVDVAGRRLVNFSSNNYLGLTHHPRVLAAMAGAVERFGAGSGAAALVSGYTPAHAAAEDAIRHWKQSGGAVLLGSGYAANLAAVQTLAAVARQQGRAVRFLLDKLAHASLVDAVRAAAAGEGVSYRVFPHNGMDKLQRLLAGAGAEQLQVVVTESVFSMDGDAADLPALAALKREYPFLLLVDEAHASGVYGAEGAGCAAELGLAQLVDISVLTLSKAVGVAGGAVVGSADFCEAVINFGRAYVYTTNVPAAVAAGVTAAVEVIRAEPWRRERVRQLAQRVRVSLAAMGVSAMPGDSPVVPIILGEEEAAVRASERLREAGLLVPAIRPPTVARGSSRLRVTLSAAHSDEHVTRLLEGLGEVLKPL